MIKAATTTLILVLFCANAPTARAQQTPAQIAGEEAVRRQADIIQLRKTLAEARGLRDKKDLAAASRRYEDALAIVQRVGIGIEKERDETVVGLVAVRMQLAENAQKRGDLTEADAQVTRALRVDPKNVAAQKFKEGNDKRIEARQGTVPSKEELARIPEFRAERAKTSTLVQDGRLLLEAGKLDEAEAKLKQAAKEDPENNAAFYYLTLIKESRYAQEARKREVSSKEALVEVEKEWNTPNTRETLPAANPFATTNIVYTGTGRQLINHKLDKIVLDEFLIPGDVPLSEVIKELSLEARKRDPEKLGINFIISSHIDRAEPAANLGPIIDPTTGQPLAQGQGEANIIIEDFTVKIDPPLKNVRLMDVVDAIVKVAKPPTGQPQSTLIKASTLDYAVVFSQRTPEQVQLYTRRYRVDPNTFLQGLEAVTGFPLGTAGGTTAGGGVGGVGGGGGGGAGSTSGSGIFNFPRVDLSGQGGGTTAGGIGGGGGGGGAGGSTVGGFGIASVTRTNLQQNIQTMVRQFFLAAGLDFQTNVLIGQAGFQNIPGAPQRPQKALFFNDRTGILFVRSTMEDLDVIENAVQALNVAPPQVTIEAKFTEITQSDSKALGFDWLLGNTLMNGGALGLSGGSAPSFLGKPSLANPTGVFPGEFGIPSQSPNLQTVDAVGTADQKVTSGLRNLVRGANGSADSTIPAVATVTGILTDPQFRLVIRALEQRSGVDLLASPRVTTVSGRQAQFQSIEVASVVAGFANAGTTAAGGGLTGGGGAATVAQTPVPISVPLGPSLDVIPYVSADGFSVQMTLIPTIVEFVGYDDSPFLNTIQAVGTVASAVQNQSVPLPRFRVRQVTTSANVWDGQTIVLGGLISEDVRKNKDKVPVLGDIPLLGRFFRSESSSTIKKNLVIFVTPTIIDPAGNRVHTPDNLPYDPNTIPSQPAPTP